jgi:multiple sugar transport system substrate-binding protein
MKKILLLALVLVASVFVLATCGNDDNGNGNGAETVVVPALGNVEVGDRVLRLGIWRGNDAEWASIERVREDFTRLTGIPVEFIQYSDFNMQLTLDLIAGTAPDAFYVELGSTAGFVEDGILAPLDRASFNTAAFYANSLDAFTFNGNVYAIPKDQSLLARYVNTSLLRQVGFELSDIPDSLEEYLEFLPRLQAALDAEFGPGQRFAASGLYELARSMHLLNREASIVNADGTANFSNPAVVRHVEFLASLFATGAMRTPQAMGAGWNGEAFGNELMVIMEEGNWVYGNLRTYFPHVEFEIIDMPTYMGQRSSMLFTVGWGINAASPNQDLAAIWIEYKTGLEGMHNWSLAAGPLPTRGDVAANMAPFLSPGLNTHVAQSPYVTPWVAGRFHSLVYHAFNNYMTAAIEGEMTVLEAMQAADSQANMQINIAR